MRSDARLASVSLSVVAAFLWASYYGFFLGLGHSVTPVGLIAYPFLAGGAVLALWAVRSGHGEALRRLFLSAAQWGRVLMFLGIQVSIVAVTILSGPVDAALLSLVGDVALTPLFVMAIFQEGRDRLRSPLFLGGILLSGFGAALTIFDGGRVAPLGGYGLLAAPLIPILIAGFFVSSSRAAREYPSSAVLGQAALGAGALALPLAFLLPASVGALAVHGALPVVLLVGCGLTSFALAPMCYFEAIGRSGILLPALLQAGIPVFTLGFTAALSGHTPGWIGLAGIPVAVTGAVLAVQGSHAVS